MNKHTLDSSINAPVARVFAYTIDPANTPKWCEGIVHEEKHTDDVGVGTKYTNELGTLSVTDFEQDRRFELTSEDGSYTVRYEYSSLDDATTKLSYTEWMNDGSGLAHPLEQTSLDKLKDLIESEMNF